jgi:hypothetical protein
MSTENSTQFGPDSSVADLENELARINGQRDLLGAEAKKLAGCLNTARAREEAAAKVGAMTDAEREALRRALG